MSETEIQFDPEADLDGKIEVVKYFQMFINSDLFDESNDYTQYVMGLLHGFAKEQLQTLFGKPPEPKQDVFTEQEISALKAIAKSVLSKPTQAPLAKAQTPKATTKPLESRLQRIRATTQQRLAPVEPLPPTPVQPKPVEAVKALPPKARAPVQGAQGGIKKVKTFRMPNAMDQNGNPVQLDVELRKPKTQVTQAPPGSKRIPTPSKNDYETVYNSRAAQEAQMNQARTLKAMRTGVDQSIIPTHLG